MPPPDDPNSESPSWPSAVTEGEERILRAGRDGDIASLLDLAADQRVVRASLVRAVMFAGVGPGRLGVQGLQVIGARIAGELDLSGLGAPDATAPPLHLMQVEEADGGGIVLSLTGAMLAGLDLSRSRVSALRANHLRLGRSLILRDTICTGECVISLRGAQVAGDAVCGGLRGNGSAGCERPKLRLSQARIDGSLRLQDSRLGLLDVAMATIGGQLDLEGARITAGCGKTALFGDGANILGDVLLTDGARVIGETRLLGARIAGNLELRKGVRLRNGAADALSCDEATITGSVFLHTGVVIHGAVRFHAARIGGALLLRDGARLRHAGQDALCCDRAVIGAGLFIGRRRDAPTAGAGIRIDGAIRMHGARIDGPIDTGGPVTIRYPHGDGLVFGGEGLKVGGSVNLSGCDLHGTIQLTRAEIGGALNLTDARLVPPLSDTAPRQMQDDCIVSMEGARIGTTLEVRRLHHDTRGVIDLRGCHAAHLADSGGTGWSHRALSKDEPAYDEGGRHLSGVLLRIDGFTYDRLDDYDGVPKDDRRAAKDARRKRHLGFLLRQFPGRQPEPHHYAPQSFEQVAKALRLSGRPEEGDWFARKKRVFRTKCAVDRPHVRLWHWVMNFLFGHFYSPRRAFATLGVAVGFGIAMLMVANATGAFVEKRSYVDLRPGAMLQLQRHEARPGADDLKPARKPCWAADAFQGARIVAWLPIDPGGGWQGLAARFALRFLEAGTFALDLLMPLVDLKLDQRCEIDTDRDEHRFWSTILAFYSGLGLLLVPLFIATVSGLARRD